MKVTTDYHVEMTALEFRAITKLVGATTEGYLKDISHCSQEEIKAIQNSYEAFKDAK